MHPTAQSLLREYESITKQLCQEHTVRLHVMSSQPFSPGRLEKATVVYTCTISFNFISPRITWCNIYLQKAKEVVKIKSAKWLNAATGEHICHRIGAPSPRTQYPSRGDRPAVLPLCPTAPPCRETRRLHLAWLGTACPAGFWRPLLISA